MLPYTFEVQSARHIFMIEAREEMLGATGYFVFAFGLNNYMMIHVDQQYDQPTSFGYSVVWIKEYQNIVAQNQRERMSTVVLSDDAVSPVPRTRFFQRELTFFLGGAS